MSHVAGPFAGGAECITALRAVHCTEAPHLQCWGDDSAQGRAGGGLLHCGVRLLCGPGGLWPGKHTPTQTLAESP